MTASKISRPNSFLSSSAVTPRNGAFDNYRNPSQLPQNVNSTKRCLFGTPDSNETKRLYNESVEQSRQRFISRYGFDTVTGQPVRSSSSISSSSSSSAAAASSSRNSPTRDYSRPIDESKKPYTRQQQQKSSIGKFPAKKFPSEKRVSG